MSEKLDKEVAEDLKNLEAAIDFSPEKKVKDAEVKQPEAETHEKFKAAAEATIEPKPEEKTLKDPSKVTIFDDLGLGTEEDESIGKGIIDSIADKAKDMGNAVDSPQDHKVNCRVKADAHIEFFDVGIALLCCFLTKDYTHTNQSKFTLHKDRKKALADSLSKIYEKSKKPVNPMVDLIILGLSCYAPIIVYAIVMRNDKNNAHTVAPPAPQMSQTVHVPFIPQPVQPASQTMNPNSYMPPMGSAGKRGVQPGEKRGPYKKNK